MKQSKAWLLPILLLLCSGLASAAFTITWNEPTSGTTYNNTPANEQTIDLNFTIVDDNGTMEGTDYNINLRYYQHNTAQSAATDIVAMADWNGMASTVSDMNCVGGNPYDGADANWQGGRDCTYQWLIPDNDTIAPSSYYVDVNVVQCHNKADGEAGTNCNYDGNATNTITINNSIANLAATKSLIQNIGLVLAAVVLFTVLALGVYMQQDLKVIVIVGVASAIAVGIGAMIVGIVMGIM